MDPQIHPLAAFSLIAAPAILTNASSVLVMSTSNRLARAVDRAREHARPLDSLTDFTTPEAAQHVRDLVTAEKRTLLLLTALRCFYFAMGSFASASLISLFGAIFVALGAPETARVFETVGVIAGLFAVGALVRGSQILLRETRLAVQVISERAARVQERLAKSHSNP